MVSQINYPTQINIQFKFSSIGTTYLKTIEVYDAEANNWKLCGSMNFRRLGGGVGVVRMPQSDSRLW